MDGSLAVISQTGETLSFFDLAAGQRTAHLTDLLSEPHELCYDSKRHLIYITHAYRHGHYWSHGDDSHEISVVDVATKTVVDVIDLNVASVDDTPGSSSNIRGAGPHGIWLNREQDVLYVSVEVLYSPQTTSTTTTSEANGTSTSGGSDGGGGIITIDLTTRKITSSTPSTCRSHWFAMTPDSSKAYTCNKTTPFTSVLDLKSHEMIGKIQIPTHEEPGMSLDGKRAYFPTPGFRFGVNPPEEERELVVIDTERDCVVTEGKDGERRRGGIKLKYGALGAYVTPRNQILVGSYWFPEKRGKSTANGGGLIEKTNDSGALDRLVAADAAAAKEAAAKTGGALSKSGEAAETGFGRLVVYDGETHEYVGEAPIGKWVLTIRCSDDGRYAFTANIMDGTVSVVDLDRMETIRTLMVDTKKKEGKAGHVGAHGMAYIPKRD